MDNCNQPGVMVLREGKRRDALFEAWDALMLQGMKSSFAWLSLSGLFRHKWHSLYKALEQGEINVDRLTDYLVQ